MSGMRVRTNDIGNAAGVGADHRRAEAERLAHNRPPPVETAWQHDAIRTSHLFGKAFIRDRGMEGDLRRKTSAGRARVEGGCDLGRRRQTSRCQPAVGKRRRSRSKYQCLCAGTSWPAATKRNASPCGRTAGVRDEGGARE